MSIEFFDVKFRKWVVVDESNIRKVTFDTKSGVRYGFKGKSDDNRNLTLFVSKQKWDALQVPEGDFQE